ncbi:MAG TPA: MmgE/PrpD family protein [Burkholderiaceae bacterium]|jgi:2-methylcitrate dehydratase PrpD
MSSPQQTTPPHQPTLTEQLARYWSGATFDDLPDDVVALCKRSLLDTIVVGRRGAETFEADITAQGSLRFSPETGGVSTVWGMQRKTTPALAARINGTSSHALELDDFGGCGHSGACVVPAVCALADAVDADGKTVLRAVAAGYDVAARVLDGAGGYRAQNDRGWHSTGTCGTFGAAAAAAVMLGLDAERTAWALGIAGSLAGGTWAFLADGATTKRFHPGMAAESGVEAACLAAAGMTGPRDILEAPYGGFFSVFSGPEARPAAVVAGLGGNFRIAETGIKVYACCRGLHSPIEALLDIVLAHDIAPDAIDAIVIHGAARTVRQFSKRQIDSVLDGQFSLPYSMAVAALHREATLAQFAPPQADDPAVQALMARVDVRGDRDLAPYDEPQVELRLKSGESFLNHVPVSKGNFARPVPEAELARKHQVVGEPVMGEKLATLRSTLQRLERLGSFREVSLLVER